MGLFDAVTGLFGVDESSSKINAPSVDPDALISKQAQVNRVNQITPFGNVTFSGPDRNQLNFALSPEMQKIFNQQSQFGYETSNLGRGLLAAVPETGEAAVQAILQRMQPQFDQQQNRLRERLEQSGNPAALGTQFSEGAFNDLALLNQSQNDARLAAVMQAPAYQGQLLQNALAAGSGSPLGVPQFNFQGATPLDVLGPHSLANQAASFNAQQQQQSNSSKLGGLFDLGAAAFSFFG